MHTDQTIYLTNAKTITIERVPSRGLVRIRIKGADDGGFGDEMALTIWGDQLKMTMPKITDTTSDEPSLVTVRVLAELDEEADI